MWRETKDINQIASAERRFFSPFFFESDSCLTESDKAERSVWRQASQDVECCLTDDKESNWYFLCVGQNGKVRNKF